MANWSSSVPSLSALIAFEAAHRHQNFTQAAAELHYSQATVSRRVAALEADLGAVLFDRGGQAAAPTDFADELASAVRTALTDLARVSDDIRNRSATKTRLTIRSDVSLTSAVVNPALGALRQQHPELDIRVLSSFEPIETENEEFDLGLQYGRNRTSSFLVEPAADDEVFPVCAPGLAADMRGRLDSGDVTELPLLHVDYGEPAWVDWQQFLEFVGIDTSGGLSGPTFSTYLVCLDLAERGEGIALGWGHTARPPTEAGPLERIPDYTMAIPDAVLSYRHPSAPSWEPLDDLLELIRNHLR